MTASVEDQWVEFTRIWALNPDKEGFQQLGLAKDKLAPGEVVRSLVLKVCKAAYQMLKEQRRGDPNT